MKQLVLLRLEMQSLCGYPFCLKIGHFTARTVTEITWISLVITTKKVSKSCQNYLLYDSKGRVTQNMFYVWY